MSDIQAAELLEKGAAHIEEHGLWQGAFWDNSQLSYGSALEAGQVGAPACGLGALHIQAVLTDCSLVTYYVARDALDTAAPHGEFPPWNDTPGRTAAEVADAMRECAKGLRGDT